MSTQKGAEQPLLCSVCGVWCVLQVVIRKVSNDVSEAAPFATSYGKTLDKSNQNLLWASTLVLRVPFTEAYFAIITNPYGPAEW